MNRVEMNRISVGRKALAARAGTVAFLVLVLAGPLLALDWQITTVQVGGEGGFVALDSAGMPQIAYRARLAELGQYALTYASWNGSSWEKQVLGDGIPRELAFGHDGLPRLLYDTPNLDAVTFAVFRGQTWDTQVIARQSGGSRLAGRAFALDSSDSPHVVYNLIDGGGTRYATLHDLQWSTEVAGPPDFQGLDIVLDSATNAGIAGGRPGGLYYYTRSVTWQGQQVSSGFVGWSSAALDSTGNPRIAHCVVNDDILEYSFRAGSSWTTQIVDCSHTVAGLAALALDSLDRPSILYPVNTEEHVGANYLKYARWDGTEWIIEQVDPDRGANLYAQSMVIDAQDRVHVAYYADKSLKYAVATIPEPATLWVLALGGLALLRRRRAEAA
jgi:hypothetical protein